MDPNQVTSPKSQLRNLLVIHTDANEGWSVAEFDWLDHSGVWRQRVGMRWNGEGDALGNPQSSGHATWFVMPEATDAAELVRVMTGKSVNT